MGCAAALIGGPAARIAASYLVSDYGSNNRYLWRSAVTHKKTRSDGGFFLQARELTLDRAAAVLVVRLFGWVCHHVRLDFLHFATTGEELFHGASQSITLFVFGFNAGQVINRHRSLGFAFGRRDRRIVASVVVCNVFGCRVEAFFVLVFVTYFEVIIFQIIVAHVLPHDLRKAD